MLMMQNNVETVMSTDLSSSIKKPTSIHQKGSSFPVRRMDFDFSNINRHFLANDPACSHVWTAFQAYFPEGEQFFVDAVRDAKKYVKDEALLREISAFIGQEAMHGKEHKVANLALAKVGINVNKLERAAGWVRKQANQHLGKKLRLAMTAAAEHFTGVIAEQIAFHPGFLRGVTDPQIKQLILWHAMEETEHRAVAFDLYKHTNGDYLTRALGMGIISAGIAPVVLVGMLSCLRQTGQLTNRKAWAEFLVDYWGPKGFFTQAVPELMKYFKADFHPNQGDPEELLHAFRRYLNIESTFH